jgi:proline iminopeptidase
MDRHLSRTMFAAAAVFFLVVISGSCTKGPAIEEPSHGESILDRTEHVEPTLLTEIPETFRWCERIEGLDKRRIDVGDAELYVEVEGKGTPLVLINGGPGGTHHYFHPWFSRLRGQAKVVYYDQRGCGLSDFKPGEKGYSVEQAVADLEAVRKALGLEKWVVLGYSYGGFLAQLYTVLHPENTAGLVLLGASPGMKADVGPSREGEFITAGERERMKEARKELNAYAETHALPRQKFVELLIYNNFINGDWKRQNFYRPSADRLAQIALYEWVNDQNFNGIMGQSQAGWDFTGAFADNPIPTLILEGRWDLTWGEKKREVLKGNHPRAEMIVFENAAHGIYDEDPDGFFRALKSFLKGLKPVDEAALADYRRFLRSWVEEMESRPDIAVDRMGWGIFSSRELAARYSPEWLETLDGSRYFMRVGFALYDVERYDDALAVFERIETRFGDDQKMKAFGLIWQGHMLDLLGRRPEALARYQRAAALNVSESWMHGQYGLKYELSPYARERLKTPFKRVENTAVD